MAWIESHDNLPRHPKTLRLADLLSVSVPTAIGHLHCLWYWVLAFADDGDLTGFTPSELARAALWTRDTNLFIDALVRCGQQGHAGFLERTADSLLVHDWDDYAGRLVARRRTDAARKRAIRKTSTGHPQDVGAPSAGHPQDVGAPSVVTVPNLTLHNPTEPVPPVVVPPQPDKTAAAWLPILQRWDQWPRSRAANEDVQRQTEELFGHLNLEVQAQKFVWHHQDSHEKLTKSPRKLWFGWLENVRDTGSGGTLPRHPEEVDRKEYLRRYGHLAPEPTQPDGEEGA